MKETYNNENLHDELTIKIKEFIENMEEFKTTPFIKTDKKCLKGFGIMADNGHDNVMKRFTIVVEDHKSENNTKSTFYDRLLIEKSELATKKNALNDFMRTQTFIDLDTENKNLLNAQSMLMDEYLQVLILRVGLLKNNLKHK